MSDLKISNSRVLITGQTGSLGRTLSKRFEDCDVLSIGRDHSEINRVQGFRPDYVFHFGAEIYDDKSMLESNVIFTNRLLLSIVDLPIRSFVYCGSSSEYGAKSAPMSESDILAPRNMYEATKGCGTLLCQAYAKAYDKPIVILRPFSAYGEFDRPHKFFPRMMAEFEKKGSVYVYSGSHDWIYADDFTDCVVLAANNEAAQKGEIINVGTGVMSSNKEVYESFCEAFGYSIDVEFTDLRHKDFDTDLWVANTDKAKRLLGFSYKTSLVDGIKKMIHERNR
jgi:nucleoside-diphosphate-sugar epimerase